MLPLTFIFIYSFGLQWTSPIHIAVAFYASILNFYKRNQMKNMYIERLNQNYRWCYRYIERSLLFNNIDIDFTLQCCETSKLDKGHIPASLARNLN